LSKYRIHKFDKLLMIGSVRNIMPPASLDRRRYKKAMMDGENVQNTEDEEMNWRE